MMIKDFGARVESVWEGLRAMTKKMLVGAIEANPTAPKQKFSYDAHADWELSRLLSALDEQIKDTEIRRNPERLGEIKVLAETCADVLQAQTESAEVFIQLATRVFERNDFKKIDALADILFERFPASEIAEIIRQTELAQIRAVAYETLALLPTQYILPLLEESIYYDIVRNALEQQAFEFDNEEARQIVEQLEFEDTGGE
ncbi:MAG: hypothetical protein M3525_08435 [Acidobacteriota bacterium]|nr:hypothetical protein [Acidobacteriota bacterium]